MAQEAVTSTSSPGTVTWPLTDNLGSVRNMVDDTDAVIDRLVYDSFGQVASETNAAVQHLQGYAGGIADPDTGLVNFWHRLYDPTVGRWISEDPIGFDAGAKLYAYVDDAATMNIYSSGEAPNKKQTAPSMPHELTDKPGAIREGHWGDFLVETP